MQPDSPKKSILETKNKSKQQQQRHTSVELAFDFSSGLTLDVDGVVDVVVAAVAAVDDDDDDVVEVGCALRLLTEVDRASAAGIIKLDG